MALWDDSIKGNPDYDLEVSICQEEIQAREQNGFVPQTDWWAINERRHVDGFEELPIDSFHDFLIEASPDVRHVAVLLSQEAHLDPYDLKPIFEAVHVDGSTFLVHYIYGMSMILETYYASSSSQKDGFFVKNVSVDWSLSSFGAADLEHAARLVGSSDQKFSFDCGRLQTLYAALERDLQTHGLVPDWFVPSSKLKPFSGTEPDCAFTFWDLELYREPAGYIRPQTGDVILPEAPQALAKIGSSKTKSTHTSGEPLDVATSWLKRILRRN